MKEKIFIFLVVLSALILRLINFSNRLGLWTAFLSALIIAGAYFLIKKSDLMWAGVSAVFLTISPWLVVFSRNPYSLFGRINTLFSLRIILQNYFSLFSAKYLFFSGIWPNTIKPLSYQGMMYLADAPFFILGLIRLLPKKKNIVEKAIVYSLLIFPIISSVVPGSFLISLLTGIIMVLITAKGFSSLIEKSKLFLIFIVFYLFFFIRFIDLYFIHN